MQFHYVPDLLRDIGQILLVVFGKDRFVDTVTVGRHQFFFQTADGQHLAAQGDLAGHGQVAAHGNLAQRAGDGGGDGDARRGAIFRDSTFGNVHVQVEIAVEVAAEAEALRT